MRAASRITGVIAPAVLAIGEDRGDVVARIRAVVGKESDCDGFWVVGDPEAFAIGWGRCQCQVC
jgi:hypothetical protein